MGKFRTLLTTTVADYDTDGGILDPTVYGAQNAADKTNEEEHDGLTVALPKFAGLASSLEPGSDQHAVLHDIEGVNNGRRFRIFCKESGAYLLKSDYGSTHQESRDITHLTAHILGGYESWADGDGPGGNVIEDA